MTRSSDYVYPIDELLERKSKLTESKARELWLSYLSNCNYLVHYSSFEHGIVVRKLCEQFANFHAYIEYLGDPLYTLTPLYYMSFDLIPDVTDIKAMMWKNGMVCKTTSKLEKNPEYTLWIDRRTFKTFHYPEPKNLLNRQNIKSNEQNK